MRDLSGTLGTIVNGEPIGTHFRTDDAPLRAGENEVIAGGMDSSFVFSVFVAENSGVNRSQTRGYSASTPSYSGSTVAPGGNGAVGAGDTAFGSWTGTNPGIDRRPSGSYYYGGLR